MTKNQELINSVGSENIEIKTSLYSLIVRFRLRQNNQSSANSKTIPLNQGVFKQLRNTSKVGGSIQASLNFLGNNSLIVDG